MMLHYLKLFYIFFKVGMFSFGGGYAMLPMIYKEIKVFDLMPATEFSNLVALSQMTPGPIAVNAATYVGYKSGGLLGAIFATVGVSLPSFILILIISAFFYRFKTSSMVKAVLSGIRPATIGMIASAVIFIGKTAFLNEKLLGLGWEAIKQPLQLISLPAIAIFALTIVGAKKFKMDPILLTVIAGVVGIFIM